MSPASKGSSSSSSLSPPVLPGLNDEMKLQHYVVIDLGILGHGVHKVTAVEGTRTAASCEGGS